LCGSMGCLWGSMGVYGVSMGSTGLYGVSMGGYGGLWGVYGVSVGVYGSLCVSVGHIAILCYINLLNYMDRFTVAGVLPDVEDFFSISDSSSGLLQTVFIGSYMVLAPLCGYWGDRRSRKRLLSLGLALWAAATMAGSFEPLRLVGSVNHCLFIESHEWRRTWRR
uniref:Major facilitator superfamily (MFS) profile domain-containing protein n=1 Tax=Strigops habroptila TaxID=2489341 RepID=A0A672UUK7_STRHB